MIAANSPAVGTKASSTNRSLGQPTKLFNVQTKYRTWASYRQTNLSWVSLGKGAMSNDGPVLKGLGALHSIYYSHTATNEMRVIVRSTCVCVDI